MSFGVGFGDIVKAIGLAKQLVSTYRNAPSQVKELADKISLSLDDAEGAYRILQRGEHGLAEEDKEQMLSIVQGYTSSLNKLRMLYDRNHVLTTNKSRGIGSRARIIGKRLVFDSEAVKVHEQNIMKYNSLLSTFMGKLNITATWDALQKVETLVEYKKTQESQEILSWLTDLDFGKQHTDRLRRTEPDTGNWLVYSGKFQDWLDQPGTTLLCPGMPGAGKSFIASIAIDCLQKIYRLDQETRITFLLCDFNSQQEQRPEELLASLLKQLLEGRPIPGDLEELYKHYRSKPSECRPLMDELLRCLNTAMGLYERVLVVIDALDEPKTEPRTRLMEEIFNLQQTFSLSILATLRPVQELLSLFEESGVPLHVLEIRAHRDDIQKFINSKITNNLHFLRKKTQEERNKIHLEIMLRIGQAADGMFLLAALYFDSITRCRNLTNIRKAITELPKGPGAYEKLYANTISRIQSRDTRDLAMKVLSWIAWTKRPITVRELQHALVITDGDTALDGDNITHADDLVSSCEGLVTLVARTNIIRLAHYTTREYLESIRDTWFLDVENNILHVCLQLLSSASFESGRCQADAEFKERLECFPLYNYASRHWGYHARSSTGMNEELISFLQDTPKVEAATQCQFAFPGGYQSVPTGVTGLHQAAPHGLDEVVSRLLSDGYRVNQQTSNGRTPLFSAAYHGCQSTVAILLRHNAQVDVKDTFGRTALCVAAEHGHLEVAKNLISHGAITNLTDKFGQSPIFNASTAGHVSMVRYLLQCGSEAQADQPDNSGRTPLWTAASQGYWEVVSLLATHGANINTHLRGNPTPVSWAAQKGMKDAVDKLAAMGANINLADQEGRTPLSYAAWEGFSQIVDSLLAHKADPSLADKEGWTPLLWACDRGNLNAVSLLLLHGPSNIIEHTDRFGQTALSIASRAGHAAIVKRLLEQDCQRTTVDMPDESGWTPLIEAAKNSDPEVLDLLLDRTRVVIDVTHCDYAGKTALHWAAGLGNVAAVLRLLAASAPINATDTALRTPLWQATRNGHFEAVKALLSAYAAVDVADALQRTPLRLAIENGHDSIAEILLDHKAELEVSATTEWAFLHTYSLSKSPKVREHVERLGSDAEGDADMLGLSILFT
ncbi:hypothetical protein FDECE_1223 [Fusarium decemcellulare]|nr:hypothetical protein FDECE_1223 [Fusarium decemcellulare]